jgi:16S rRNA processing protein RimM
VIWDDLAIVGCIARAHGNRGQVIVNPETDFPAERFRPGAELLVRRGEAIDALRLTTARLHQGRPVIGIEGVETMNDAAALAGLELRVPQESLKTLPAGTYYHHDLVGCRVETTAGENVGVVAKVEASAGGSRLVVEGARGEILIPLVAHICTAIDVAAKTVVVDPPEGLLELNIRGVR